MLDFAKSALGAFASVFSPSAAPSAAAPWERRLLLLLVIAAAIVRFWGLGAVGLHAPDEDTVALPAVHLAQDGEPVFPSGMYYARAIVQTYLIAGSIKALGVSEWAMRLPSAVCGVLLVFLSYYVGKRFLQPAWNLAFVASVAFLPELVMQSQTARMYIFLVTCIAAYLLYIFAWERTGRSIFLVGALAMLLLGIQFQTLMIFASLVLFYPGLLQADGRKLWMASVAFFLALVGFWLIDKWAGSFYIFGKPRQIAEILGVALPHGGAVTTWRPRHSLWFLAFVPAIAGPVSWLVARQLANRWARGTTAALLFLGLGAQLLLNYHIALVLLVAGVVVAFRNGAKVSYPLWILAAVSAVIGAGHIVWLNAIDIGSRGVILEAMVGVASIWPFIRYLPVSYAGAALVTAGSAVALWRLAVGRRVPALWLFVLLAVWAPLFLIGCFDQDPEFRYMTPVLLPLLIAAFATGQWLVGLFGKRSAPRQGSQLIRVLAVIMCALVINPIALARTINAGYGQYPDHKGAGLYVKSLQLGPHDIVIAEDAIMQMYYLGRVDYLLTNVETALRFSRVENGQVREVYSNARVIATAEQLQSVLSKEHCGDIYIIGSGENFVRGRRWQRGTTIDPVLRSLEVVYEGRDGLTKVWKIPASGRSATPGNTSDSPPCAG